MDAVIEYSVSLIWGSNEMTIWVARAGKHGERENLALDEKRAFIGWVELGDLSQVTSREEIQRLLEEANPDVSLGSVRNHAGQVYNFVNSIEVGDILALPLKSRPAIAFAEVASKYEYLADNPEDARHSRKIKWIGDPVPRKNIDQDLLYSFGSILTVFRVTRNNAEERIKALLSGEKLSIKAELGGLQNKETEDVDALDLESVAKQQISDFIGRRFKGYKMENLVAEVLKAQGFEVRLNKRKGADGGADILAGKGPMGFDEPRLCVQVKSTDSAIGSKEFDELNGVMTKFGATHGLLVSWGGFTGKAEEEAKRKFFDIRLWNADDVVSEIQAVYSSLPHDLQAELPMQPIWMLVDDD